MAGNNILHLGCRDSRGIPEQRYPTTFPALEWAGACDDAIGDRSLGAEQGDLDRATCPGLIGIRQLQGASEFARRLTIGETPRWKRA
jgi:hypothetical protein